MVLLTILMPALMGAPARPDDWDGLRSALVAMGDLNGDGVADLALAHRPRPFLMGDGPSAKWPVVDQEPVVWLISGVGGSVLHALSGPGRFGTGLACIGDIDGDGAQDLAVSDGLSADRLAPNGTVTLVSGGTGWELAQLSAPKDVLAFGCALAGGLQLTGDDTPDFVISAYGGAFVFDGAAMEAAWILEPQAGCGLVRTPATEGARLATPSSSGAFPVYAGMNVGVIADLDHDGLAELALSTFADAACGEAGLPIGHAQRGGRTRIWPSAGQRAVFTVESSAWSTASGEDLDDDGVPDFVTTEVNEHVRAWSGATGKLLWECNYEGGYLLAEGASLSFTSDHDGDCVRDLLIGANETDFDADHGFVAIVSGRSGIGIKAKWIRDGYGGGADAVPIGDLDGDGLEEIAVWEPVPQRLQLLRASDFEPLWSLDVTALARPK
jgi:hypothetical protein